MKVIPFYTYEKLIALFNYNNIEPVDLINYVDGNWNMDENWMTPEEYEEILPKVLKLKSLGHIEMVYSKGGGEGEGEHCEKVVHFKNFNIFIKMYGKYYSYDGEHWEHSKFNKVLPYTVQRVEFHPPDTELKNEEIKEYLDSKINKKHD